MTQARSSKFRRIGNQWPHRIALDRPRRIGRRDIEVGQRTGRYGQRFIEVINAATEFIKQCRLAALGFFLRTRNAPCKV